MKRFCAVILTAVGMVMCLMMFGGCSDEGRIFTAEEISAAYSATDFEVVCLNGNDFEAEYLCDFCVHNKADDENAHVYLFADAAEADEFARAKRWNLVLWFFSVMYNQPTWIHTKCIGNAVVQYSNRALADPFLHLAS